MVFIMKTLFVLLAMLLLSSIAHAEIYKCKSGDKTVFSDTPCAGGVTVKIEGAPPAQKANVAASTQAEKFSEANVRIKKKLISEDIERAEARIYGINKNRDAQLSELSARVSGASRNVREAVDKNTMAAQMGVINDAYNRQIADVQRDIDNLKRDRDNVK